MTPFVFSSTCATYGEPIETPIAETHPQRPINSYGETQAGRRARAAALRARAWHPLRSRCATSTPPAPIPTARSARTTRRRFTSSRARIDAATRRTGLQVFGDDYPTPDGTCLRDYIHVTDLADAHVRALEALAETGRSAAYNLGTGQPHSVREVDRRRRARHRADRCRGRWRRGGRAIRRSLLRGGRQGATAAGLDARGFPALDDDRADRVGLAPSSIRAGIADEAPAPRSRRFVDPLLSVVMPAYNERDTIDEIVRRVLAVPLAHRAASSSTTARPTARASSFTRAAARAGFTLILQPANAGKGAALRARVRAGRPATS